EEKCSRRVKISSCYHTLFRKKRMCTLSKKTTKLRFSLPAPQDTGIVQDGAKSDENCRNFNDPADKRNGAQQLQHNKQSQSDEYQLQRPPVVAPPPVEPVCADQGGDDIGQCEEQ